jgi:hypothetical protein
MEYADWTNIVGQPQGFGGTSNPLGFVVSGNMVWNNCWLSSYVNGFGEWEWDGFAGDFRITFPSATPLFNTIEDTHAGLGPSIIFYNIVRMNGTEITGNLNNIPFTSPQNPPPPTIPISKKSYYRYVYNPNNKEWSVTIFLSKNEALGITAPCFSYKTLQKILAKIPKNMVVTLKSERYNKDMIKAYHEDLGELEFTNDHPFIYNNNYVTFEELVKLNPKFSISKELPLEDCDILYNIVGHPKQTHPDNIFILANDLHMIGAKYPENCDSKYFLKKKKVIENLLNSENSENTEFIRKKYGLVL